MSNVIRSARWPRLLTETAAAEYVGADRRRFLLWVADGTMPSAIETDAGKRWDKVDLDDAVDALKAGTGRRKDWRENSPLYRGDRAA